jgi:two-component system, LytTR family, response regulator
MIRTIIVDDEELARRGIRKRLSRQSDFQVVAECSNAREATQAINSELPDVVFLDVQLPGQSGIELLSDVSVKRFPHIIFVTAHDQYAIKAFEIHALDYLLKPIDDERFASAVDRARGAIQAEGNLDITRRIAEALDTLQARSGLAASDRLVIRSGGRVVFARYNEIDWVEAAGDYVTVHCGPKCWLMRETMSTMEHQLKSRGFVRIHRSAIVRIQAISEMRALDNGEYRVSLRCGAELRLSRNYRDALPRMLGTPVRG